MTVSLPYLLHKVYDGFVALFTLNSLNPPTAPAKLNSHENLTVNHCKFFWKLGGADKVYDFFLDHPTRSMTFFFKSDKVYDGFVALNTLNSLGKVKFPPHFQKVGNFG